MRSIASGVGSSATFPVLHECCGCCSLRRVTVALSFLVLNLASSQTCRSKTVDKMFINNCTVYCRAQIQEHVPGQGKKWIEKRLKISAGNEIKYLDVRELVNPRDPWITAIVPDEAHTYIPYWVLGGFGHFSGHREATACMRASYRPSMSRIWRSNFILRQVTKEIATGDFMISDRIIFPQLMLVMSSICIPALISWCHWSIPDETWADV